MHDPGPAEAGGQVEELAAFREAVYGCLTARRDALFELVDALTCRPGRVDSLPALSLEPELRRGHGGLYGALTRGGIVVDRLRERLLATVAAGRDGLVWFAGDVSNWARPDAACSPARLRIFDRSSRSLAGDPVTAGWPYAVLAGLEWGPTSWTAPVDATRLGPSDSLTEVTLAQIERVLTGFSAAGRTETPGFVLDADYDLMAFSHALSHTPNHPAGGDAGGDGGAVVARAHIVGRLRSNQVFHADPEPDRGGRKGGRRGRPRRHGAAIKLNDPDSLGTPDRTAELDSPRYGRVRLSAWDHRHRRQRREGYWAKIEGPLPIVRGSVIRVEVERLSGKGGRPDKPMWLWHAGPTPLELGTIFAVYQRRFDLEHTFRFVKQDLGWTLPAPLLPETADRWTWLVLTAYTQLRLARPICHDLRLPWEKPAEPERLSPRRVRRDFRRLHALLGNPANPPKPTRAGPGRPRGSTRPPHERHPSHRKHSRTRRKQRNPAAKTKPTR